MTKHTTDLRLYVHPGEYAYIRTTTVSDGKSAGDVTYGSKEKPEYLAPNLTPIMRLPSKL